MTTTPTSDQVRDALRGARADAPTPHPWAEVERRAATRHGRSPTSHPATSRIAVAAALILVVVGVVGVLALLDGDNGGSVVRTIDQSAPSASPGPAGGSTVDQPAPSASTDPAGGSTSGPLELGNFDASSLRPLASLSPGDIVIPTAPPNWTLSGSVRIDGPLHLLEGERHALVVSTGRPGYTVEIWYGPCDEAATRCKIVDNGIRDLGKPTSVEMTINGVEWGYSDQDDMPAALIGGHLLVVSGVFLDSPIPLLDDPDIVAFLEGLRVGSLDDLPDTVTVTDSRGRPHDQTTGDPP